jgi:N-acetylglucosamine-6-phosphate deacetylase
MSMQAIFADRAFTPYEEITDAVVLVDGRKITAVGRRGDVPVSPSVRRFEAPGLTIVPGFVDVHIHGAAGHDVMEATGESLALIAETVALRGTTSFLATTVTASEESTCRATEGIADYVTAPPPAIDSGPPRAEILGVHFEGPFISHVRRGVHPSEWIALPSIPLLHTFLHASRGTARILTLAPELPGALDLVAAARDAGLVVSLGHTDATYVEAMRAIDCGARHAAHVFNAMRPFAHRESGVLGAVLTSPSVVCELIADGVHVDPAAMRVLLASKGPGGIVLVSDGTSATGMPDGTYRLGTFAVTVSGGVSRGAEGKLAGSTLTLDRALRNIMALGVPLPEALAMLTANPAHVLGLGAAKGALVAGADADLVLLDAQLEVAGVMTRGAGLVRFLD